MTKRVPISYKNFKQTDQDILDEHANKLANDKRKLKNQLNDILRTQITQTINIKVDSAILLIEEDKENDV